ncbi:MAG: GAF domain-containing protein [Janthinobacterium lividum]
MDATSSVSISASGSVSTATLQQSQGRIEVATADSSDSSNRVIQDLLRTMRTLLDMDIAFVSEFVDDHLTMRHLDTEPTSASLISVGASTPLAQTYCKRVNDGHFPNVIPDVLQLPEAVALPGTAALNIAAYLSVPVTLRNGEIYGTLCCISHAPRTALGSRQIDALRKVAEIVSHELEKLRG